MKSYFPLSILSGAVVLFSSSPALAQLGGGGLLGSGANQDCAIWLCLPSQFPEGCGEAESALYSRLAKGQPPLPAYDQCSAGSLGGTGSYTIGYGTVATCERGYKLIQTEIMDDEADAEGEDDRADEDIGLVCQKCETSAEGDDACEIVKPTYVNSTQSITLTISGQTYPPYAIR